MISCLSKKRSEEEVEMKNILFTITCPPKELLFHVTFVLMFIFLLKYQNNVLLPKAKISRLYAWQGAWDCGSNGKVKQPNGQYDDRDELQYNLANLLKSEDVLPYDNVQCYGYCSFPVNHIYVFQLIFRYGHLL